MAFLFYSSHYPAGQEVRRRDQLGPNDLAVLDANEPLPPVGDPGADGVSSSSISPSPTPALTERFTPSSALNDPNDQKPWNPQPPGITPAPSVTPLTADFLASSPVVPPTETPQPTLLASLSQNQTLSKSSSNKKYIIGGAVGGSVLFLILLSLLVFCCCKRRRKSDIERSGGDHQEGQHGYGQFSCCSHGTCTRNGGQPQTAQKTPLKPFILKSSTATLAPKEHPPQDIISLKGRSSVDDQKSPASDAVSETVYSSDSESSQRGRRRSQKRPPPLKLTSLVTPVLNGPQENPRRRADRSSPPSPHRVPAIVVEPPQPMKSGGMRRR